MLTAACSISRTTYFLVVGLAIPAAIKVMSLLNHSIVTIL